MVNALKKYYHDQMFFPGWGAVFINPFYFARKGLVKEMIELSGCVGGDLLDVGCGTKPYRRVFNVNTYRGLDIDSLVARGRGVADDLYDGKSFPYNDDSFDSVLCNQVLEHVFNPDEFLTETNRVMKLGGKLLLTVPFVWDEHEQPYDYARYSSFGLKALLQKHGFTIITHKKLAADSTVIFQLVNAYLFKLIQHWPKSSQHIFTVTVMASVNILGIVMGKLLPANPDLFLDHVVLAEKKL